MFVIDKDKSNLIGHGDTRMTVTRCVVSSPTSSETRMRAIRSVRKLPYTIRLDANGGSVSSTTVVGIVGEKIGELPVASYGDKHFAGWYTTSGVKVGEDTIVSSSVSVLVARWVEPTLVTFAPNGGTLTGATTIKAYVGFPLDTSGVAFPVAEGPADKPNHIGWFANQSGEGDQIKPTTVYDGTYTTLYAVYANRTFTVESVEGWELYEETDDYVKYVTTLHDDSSVQRLKISVLGYVNFTVKIRSEAETGYDYMCAFDPDYEPSTDANDIYEYEGEIYDEDSGEWLYGVNRSEHLRLTTRQDQYMDIPVDYQLDGGPHTIWFAFRKDSSYSADPDLGFVIIQKGQ